MRQDKQVEKFMSIKLKILIVVVCTFSFIGVVKADSGPPSQATYFYFKYNKKPILQPVYFTVECYGVPALRDENNDYDGKEKVFKISELSETCLFHGCYYDTTNVFWAYRIDLKYCDLKGRIGDQEFIENDFFNKLDCRKAYNSAAYDRYYLLDEESEGFKECLKKENFNICDKKYTTDVTDRLLDRWTGYPYNDVCSLEINVPVGTPASQQSFVYTDDPSRLTFKDFLIQVGNFLKCNFLKIFNKEC